MKSWKKQLKDEFDRAVPALKNEILNAPILNANNDTELITQQNQAVIKRKISIGFICVAFALIMIFIFLAVFGVFNPTPAIESFIYVYEINPKIAFITDKNGIVKNITALNEDADIILYNEDIINKLKNIPLSESIILYSDSAAKLGYLNVSSNNNVVRLSCNNETDTNLISDITNSLTNYFCKNGIFVAVVNDMVDTTELCKRMNLQQTNDIRELTNMLQNLSVKFGERITNDLNKEELNKLYENYVLGKQIFDLVQQHLQENIVKIVKNAELLLNISTLNMQIMSHKDNPSTSFIKDYWSVSKISADSYTEEFSMLMTNITKALNEYKLTFNISINSIYDLMSAVNVYSSFSDQDLNEVICSLSSEDFCEYASNFLGMLKNIGYDISEIAPLLSVPQTIEEYIQLTQTATNLLYNDRLQKYLGIFNEQRDEITKEEYQNYIKNIENQYGSLSDYWKNK